MTEEVRHDRTKLIGILIGFMLLMIIDISCGYYLENYQVGSILEGSISISILVMSVFFILKYQCINIRMVIVAYCFGILVSLRPNAYTMGFLTISSYIGAQCLFQKMDKGIPVFKAYTLKGILLSIGSGILIGSIIAVIDLSINYDVSWKMHINQMVPKIVKALCPGIGEEISFRYFIYAVCLYICRGNIEERVQYILTFILMLIPHVLIHFPAHMSLMTPNVFVIEFVKLTILFGIPLTVIQLKRDLMTAIMAHFTLDLVIFSFVGC